MELIDAFNTSVYVPNITTLQSVEAVLTSLGSFDARSRAEVSKNLATSGVDLRISVGIKKLIYMIEMAAQDEDKVEKLVTTITDEGSHA